MSGLCAVQWWRRKPGPYIGLSTEVAWRSMTTPPALYVALTSEWITMGTKTVSELRRQLRARNPRLAVIAAQTIGGQKLKSLSDDLLHVLKTTDDGRVRNQCAIALSDLRDRRVIDAIVKLLHEPKTSGNRGSLLYALEPFDCRPLLPLISRTVVKGNFEQSWEAYTLLKRMKGHVGKKIVDECITLIRRNAPAEDDDRYYYVEQALKRLRRLGHRR